MKHGNDSRSEQVQNITFKNPNQYKMTTFMRIFHVQYRSL